MVNYRYSSVPAPFVPVLLLCTSILALNSPPGLAINSRGNTAVRAWNFAGNKVRIRSPLGGRRTSSLLGGPAARSW